MIPFEEAQRFVMEAAVQLGKETVPLETAYGRVLCEDIYSDVDMPPFDKSARDGYAIRSEDLDKRLKIIETIPAGRFPGKVVGECECAKIMTGSVVPHGADRVVMIEHTEMKDNAVIVTERESERNICYKAEDVRAGDVVLKNGTVVAVPEVAVLAAVGCALVPVSRRPVVGIVATGSELVEPSQKPSGAEIRNSNSYQLCSQAERAGCEPVYLGIAEDSPEAIGRVIDRNFSRVDVFLVSGGVSMGEFDYVPRVLEEKGFELLFEKVAVKPGKPTVFGKIDSKYVFGIPGNPVSTFVIFELFVKPFCYRLMGCDYSPVTVTAKLAETIKRKKAERLEFIPVSMSPDGEVGPVDYHGSAHIHAYTAANGFISIEVGEKEIEAGKYVKVTLIR
ncbi:MAG: molybdopterin molybdotransferase MoeA [Candidatus Krumholzibacteria bacterium]|nr:molybdopterin molybdotransferase MoeA [Candidatus Krumholzibacteria bacterium]